jgi:hypothetical protein
MPFQKGSRHSEETLKRMSLCKMGSQNSMFGKSGSLNHRYGKHHTEESKRKMSEMRRGKDFKEIEWEIDVRGCWVCTSHARSDGYPCVMRNGKLSRISRFTFENAYGEIPAGLYVCHTCDNRACINPEHLFLGTPEDNSQDAARKLRLGKKLNPLKIQQIRNLFFVGIRQRVIAVQFGVSQSMVSFIVLRKKWNHVSEVAS